MSQNEIDAALLVRSDEVNTQLQTKIVWPPATAVARAYVDQLARTKALDAERLRAMCAALDKSDEIRTGKEKNASAVLDELTAAAAQIDRDAAAATGRDQMRLRALSETIKQRVAKLRG